MFCLLFGYLLHFDFKVSERKQTSLLNSFGFTSKKLNREEAGSAAANASTCPGSEPEPGPWLQPKTRQLVTEAAGCVEKRRYPWTGINTGKLPATGCATIQSVFTSVCGPKRTSCAQS